MINSVCKAIAFALLSGVLCAAGAAQAVTVFSGTTTVGHTLVLPTAVSVNLPNGGSPTSAIGITQSATKSEFTVTDGGTCTSGQTFSANQSCTVNVSFSPLYPGVRAGAIVIKSASDLVLGTALVSGTGLGSLSVIQPGVINTVIGNGAWIYRADNVAATAAPIFLPTGITEDAAGNLYVSDTNNNRVRRVDGKTGIITTVAGTGSPGYNGDGMLAINATINQPTGIALDGAGNVYFVDGGNNCVRRIDAVSSFISTVAGTCGAQGYDGDGQAATAAKLALPEGMAFDEQGDLYIADTGNNVVREVVASTGTITTVAGTGAAGYNSDGIQATQAFLNGPWGLTVALDGSLYIADMNNDRVRKVNPAGTISTVAGNGTRNYSGDGSDATTANLNAPAAVAVDPAGDLYIADSGNNRVREVVPGTTTNVINTIAGTGSEEFDGDGAAANLSQLYGPYALYFDQMGNLLVADIFHNRIREISGTTIPLQYATMRVGKLSVPQPETLFDDGNGNLTMSSLALDNAALDAATTTCTGTTALNVAASCTLGVEFAPQTIGTLVQGSVTINSDAGNSPDIIGLSGQVLSVNPTSVVLASSENPSLLNDVVKFTATISSSDSTLAGTVTFTDGSTTLCSAVAVAAKAATCSISTLTLGLHNIQASYTGDSDNAANVSAVVVQTVKQKAQLTLNVTPNPAVVLSQVTMTASASAANATPTGSVTFMDGTTALNTMTLDGSGNAVFQTTQLTPGTHSLTVKYLGDATTATAVSAVVSEGISQATTVTTLGSSNTTVQVGTAVTFTANVSSLNGTSPTGSVEFTDNGVSMGSVPLTNGVAVLTTSTLTPVQHSIVAKYDGDTDDATSDSTLKETVQQIGTTTVVTATPSPANAGATVEVQATVAMVAGATADGSITGTVTFTDGGKSIGSAAVTANGVAVISVSSVTAGSHSLVATYSGNTNYATSTSDAFTETVNSTSTTTSLGVSGSALAGKPVVLTAAVSSTTGIPTGIVTFQDGSGVNVGQASLNAQGIATFTTSTLSVGSHSLIAVYGADANYTGSTSTPQTEVISLGTTTLTLSGPPSPMNAGVSASFTATLSTNGVTPTGAVTLHDGNTVIATQAASANGVVTFSGLTLAIGPHTLTAVYAGNVSNATSTSNSVSLTIQQTSTTTTLQSNTNPQVLGQSVTLTATVTAASTGLTGSVSFVDGATALGSSPLVNGVATFSSANLAFGPHTITAVYSGDTNHATSTSTAITQHIVEAAEIGLASSLNPSVSGANVTFTVKVAGTGTIVPTGSVKFQDGALLLSTGTLDGTGGASFNTSTLSVGAHSLTAAYSGDSNYSAETSSVLTQSVTNANTQVVLTASTNPATFGSPLMFKAVITSNGGTATGVVTFTDGGTSIGSGTLDASGTATLTVSTLAAASHTVVANYAGDGKASASVSPALIVVVKETTTVAVASSANPLSTLTPVTLTAHVTNAGQGVPTGTVTFTDGASRLGIGTVDTNGNATLTVATLSALSHSIVGTYSGDNTNFGSASTPLIQMVQLRATATTLSSTVDPNNSQQITLIAAIHYTGPAAPTGTVTFTNGGTTLGSAPVDANGVATLVIIVSNGQETVVATYSGDTAYLTSASPATAVGTTPATNFTLTLNPATATIQSKEHTLTTLTVASLKNFADTMQYGCLGLPYAATCTFSSTQSELKAGGSTTMQLTIDTGDPLGAGAKAENKMPVSNVLVCFAPGMLLFGLGMVRSRRRSKLTMLALFLVFGAVVASVTGCGGLTVNGTPAGTYNFQVTARAAGAGVSESQTMTLIVK